MGHRAPGRAVDSTKALSTVALAAIVTATTLFGGCGGGGGTGGTTPVAVTPPDTSASTPTATIKSVVLVGSTDNNTALIGLDSNRVPTNIAIANCWRPDTIAVLGVKAYIGCTNGSDVVELDLTTSAQTRIALPTPKDEPCNCGRLYGRNHEALIALGTTQIQIWHGHGLVVSGVSDAELAEVKSGARYPLPGAAAEFIGMAETSVGGLGKIFVLAKTADGGVLHRFDLKSRKFDLVVSVPESWVIAAGGGNVSLRDSSGNVRTLAGSNGSELKVLASDTGLLPLAYSGGKLYVSGFTSVNVYDATWGKVASIPMPDLVTGLSANEGGEVFASLPEYVAQLDVARQTVSSLTRVVSGGASTTVIAVTK